MQFVHLLLFYCFIHTCSILVPCEISSRSSRDTIRETRIFRDVSPTLSRLRSTGWRKKILRGSFRMQLERSRTFDDHFLFINHRSFDPLEFLESFLFVVGRYSPTPPKRSWSVRPSQNSREGCPCKPNVSPFRVT